MRLEKKEVLMNYTFCEYAEKILNNDELDFMLIASGYSGQLKKMNAYNAFHLFSKGIRTDTLYWSGKFNLLVDNIIRLLQKNNCEMFKNICVKDVIKEDDVFKIILNKKTIYSKKIIFCTPKESLKEFSCLNPIKCIINKSISCKSLCRVYALFNENEEWLMNFNKKTVVNNQLRYIIPINPKKGLIMISYTDDMYTEYWNKKQNNQNELKKSIVRLIKQVLNINITSPKKVYVCYWKCGVAYWNKGVNSEIISDFMINPLANTYICGENYSLQQSWVEGALESCEKCYNKINE